MGLIWVDHFSCFHYEGQMELNIFSTAACIYGLNSDLVSQQKSVTVDRLLECPDIKLTVYIGLGFCCSDFQQVLETISSFDLLSM